jgi:nicotinamidase-related amidase
MTLSSWLHTLCRQGGPVELGAPGHGRTRLAGSKAARSRCHRSDGTCDQGRSRYAVIQFREGSPDLSRRNRTFGNRRDTQHEAEIRTHPGVAPTADEIVVVKKRVSAFTGSALEIASRSANIDSLVLCGISTAGVVLSTLRQAADLDHVLTVLFDGCADPDPEVHELLMAKVFPAQAQVLSVEQWARSLSRAEQV